MLFLLQESSSTAIVGPRGDLENNPLQDAAFGNRTEHGAPIQEEFVLQQLEPTIPSQTVDIRDDLRPEDEECFTKRIFFDFIGVIGMIVMKMIQVKTITFVKPQSALWMMMVG